MGQKVRHGGQSFNILFTMLLFLVFVLCALFTVLIGGKVYENIGDRMEDSYTGSVALGYISNKVRQGDMSGMVDVKTIEGTQVLELEQEAGGIRYVTWIYYKDGSIRELFTDRESGLSLDDGLPIVSCGGLKLLKDGNLLIMETTGEGGSSIWITLRSGGRQDE